MGLGLLRLRLTQGSALDWFPQGQLSRQQGGPEGQDRQRTPKDTTLLGDLLAPPRHLCPAGRKPEQAGVPAGTINSVSIGSHSSWVGLGRAGFLEEEVLAGKEQAPSLLGELVTPPLCAPLSSMGRANNRPLWRAEYLEGALCPHQGFCRLVANHHQAVAPLGTLKPLLDLEFHLSDFQSLQASVASLYQAQRAKLGFVAAADIVFGF